MEETRDCVVTLEQFDTNNVSNTPPKKDKNNKLISYMTYNVNGRNKLFHLQLTGRAIFGITTYTPRDNTDAPKKYSINFSIPEELGQRLDNFDEFMIDYGVEHSKVIFGKSYTPEKKSIVEALYTPLVKRGENNDGEPYPPRIQAQVPVYEGKVPNYLHVYYSQREELKFDHIDELCEIVKKGSTVNAIIDIKPWFIGGKFGLKAVLRQLIIPKIGGESVMNSYAFNDRQEGLTPTSVKPTPQSEENSSENEEEGIEDNESIEDSDVQQEDTEETEEVQESENEEEEEEEEKTPPPPKKTVSRKKVSARK